jgi:hypothetical protein
LDRESAYEVLKAKGASLGAAAANAAGLPPSASTPAGASDGGLMGSMSSLLFGTEGPRGGHRDGIAQLVVKSAVRTVGSSIGREIVRGVLGSLLGGYIEYPQKNRNSGFFAPPLNQPQASAGSVGSDLTARPSFLGSG